MKRVLIFCVAVGVWAFFARAQNEPPCTPEASCGAWSCSPGSVAYPGTLSATNVAICLGSSVTVTVSGTTFNQGQKSRTCFDSCGNPSLETVQFGYTATNWWVPAIPAVFTNTGTFTFTNNVKGRSRDFDCSSDTATVVSGTLTVNVTNSPPVIITQPASQTVWPGSNATFSVVASGCPSLTYQWWFNATNAITHATNASLTITNVQVANAGNYTVVLTDASGSVTSSVAVLTIFTTQCTPPPAGLIGWWKGENNANDSAETNNGVVQNISYTNGVVGQAFACDPENFPGNYVGVKIPDRPAYALTNAFSIEAWVRPRGNGYAIFWRGDNRPGLDPYSLSMQNNNHVRFLITDTNGHAPYVDVPLVYNQWWHLVATFDAGAGVLKLYTNGVLAGQTNTPVMPIGNLISGDSPGIGIGNVNDGANNFPFLGDIDEASLYSRALSPSEVAALYNAGAAGKCPVAAPVITVQPQPSSQTIVEGSYAILGVTATGTPTLAYQWYFNQTNAILGANSNIYVVDAIGPSVAGHYSVVVTNLYGSATSSVVSISVIVPPTIVTQPTNITVAVGGTAQFSIAVDPNATVPVFYQWHFNTTNILSGATNASLTLTNVQTTNAGNYSVTASNIAGVATSSNAVLTVIVPPSITAQPQATNVVQGASAIFNVTASGTAPLAYQWRFNGANISGATGSSYTKINAQSSDAGNYSVVVTNWAGSVTSAVAALTITIPPSITVNPTNQNALKGTNVTFTVSATGTPTLTYQWSTNGVPISNGAKYSGVTTATLTIGNAQPADAVTYSVAVSNSGGTVTSAGATLTILTSPSIVTGPANLTVIQGSNATFNVTAVGTPPLTYQWFFGSSPISGATATNYTKALVQPADAGSYSVRVSNNFGGVASSPAILTVIVPPSIATQPAAVNAAQGSNVNFSVSVASGATTPLSYQWYTNGVALANGSKYAGATSSSLWVTNVSAADVCTYSVRVTNSAGSILSLGAGLSVVGVNRIIVDGSNPEIQASNAVAAGVSITLRAMPTPANGTFPGGLPIWIITNPSGSSSTNTGVATVTIGSVAAGQYTITAQCGTTSASFALIGVAPGDANYDGIDDVLELSYGNKTPQVLLGDWLFDTPDWIGIGGQTPLAFTNLALVPGFSIGAALIASNAGPTYLVYRDVEANALVANFNAHNGSVRMLVQPVWFSGSNATNGPQKEARLFEVGSKGSTNGCWGLYLDAHGTNLYFCSETNGASAAPIKTNFVASINWQNTNWYDVFLTYSPSNSMLYQNGTLIASNTAAGVTNWPNQITRARGMAVASTYGGTNTAQVKVDELQTYNYPVQSQDVQNLHGNKHPPTLITNQCPLAPIALNFPQIQTLYPTGEVAFATNGTGNGNYGWLNWNASLYSGSSLASLLGNFNLVTNFVDADNGTTVLQIGSWLNVFAGNAAGNATAQLDALKNSGIVFGVVLWDTNKATGNNREFHASGFVNIQLLDYNLGGGGNNPFLKFAYWGARNCETPNAQPPTVQITSPTNYQIFNAPATNQPGVIPITAIAASDPSTALTNVYYYSGPTAATATNFIGATPFAIGTTNTTNYIYQWTWTNAPHGTNFIVAQAVDDLGNAANSSKVVAIVNWPPQVSAASSTNIWDETSSTLTTNVIGTVSDDALPFGVTNIQWTLVSSNGPVTIGNPTAAVTTNTFGTNGLYVFRLTANDGSATNSAQCSVLIRRRPFISITSPTTNVLVLAPHLAVNATAYDLDGTVTNVQFFFVFSGVTNSITPSVLGGSAGNTNFYTCDWTNAPIGTNTLIAIATDNDGLTKTSAPVVISIVANGPSVQITTPINQTFLVRSNITVDAVASSSVPGVTISSVEFFAGTNTATTQPIATIFTPVGGVYPAIWRPDTGGTYILTALATDSRGVSALSAPVTNFVKNLPIVTLLTPTNGQVFFAYQTNISISARAIADPSSSITNVVFYQGTNFRTSDIIGTTNIGVANVYNTMWNGVTNGLYVLTARAFDAQGEAAYSQAILIQVITNQPPAVFAGPDQVVNLSTNPVQLAGIVTDDGYPSNYLSISWSQLSGPTGAKFSNLSNPRSTITFTNLGTNVLQLSAFDGQYTTTDTVQIVVRCYVPPVVDAGSNQVFILPAIPTTNVLQGTVNLDIITNVATLGGGIEYFAPSNCAIFSVYSNDLTVTHLVLLPKNGVPVPFIDISNSTIGWNGGTVEDYVATTRDTLGGFRVGEIFYGNEYGGQCAIMRISPEGILQGNAGAYGNAWVVLTNETSVVASLWVDDTGIWGGDLLVLTLGGDVWRINNQGTATEVASGLDSEEGIITVPNDVQKYGPWAGRALVGGDGPPISAIDTNGNVAEYNLGIGAENIHIIEPNENLLGVVDFDTNIFGVSAAEFQSIVGDFLIAYENPPAGGDYLYRVHWNGTSFDVNRFNNERRFWAEASFTPEPLLGLSTNFVSLRGNVQNGCAIATNFWEKVSGPGPVTIGDISQTNTYALFTDPGTYFLRLTANDGQFVRYKDTRIDVIRNQAPQVYAGTNQVVPGTNAFLSGLVIDDPWPSNQLTISWSSVSGPDGGQVTFGWTSEVVNLTNVVVTNTVSFTIPGRYVLQLTANDGQASSSSNVVITTASTNLTLIPHYGSPTRTNTQYQITANVVDQDNNPVNDGVQVDFAVTGANPTSGSATTVGGNATFSYYGSQPGRDTIQATIDSNPAVTDTAIKDWGEDLACGNNSFGLSSGCISPDWPADSDFHFSDYYLISAVAGTQITLNYVDYDNSALVLRDPSNQVVGISLNGTLTYTPTVSGDYLAEMTDLVAEEYPNYQLALSCGTNQNNFTSPEMQIWLNGTNVPNGGTITFPIQTIGSSTNLLLVVSNAGTANLSIIGTNIVGDFVFTNDIYNSQIAIAGYTNLGVKFQASSNETSVGGLLLQYNAVDSHGFSITENYIIYLVGSAFPVGIPPSIQLTSPTTNDTFFAPATIPITAAVTPGSASISLVYFELLTTNGPVVIGVDSNGVSGTYSFNWQGISDGSYTLTAVAVDAVGRSAAATPVTVQVLPSNGDNPPVAVDDTAYVPAGSQNYIINVLNNDSDPDNDPLKIVAITTNHLAGATVSIVNGGTAISYNAPTAVPSGWDWFTYEISDGRGGLASAYVEVGLYPPAKPDVVITAPVSSLSQNPHYQTNANANVPITAYVTPSGAIVKVDFFLGESLIGEVTNGSGGYYTLTNWNAAYSVCGCGINAQATDLFGQVGSSDPIFIDVTNQDITNASGNLVVSLDNINGTNVDLTTIRDGIFNLYGRAYHALGSNVVWQLGVYNTTDGSLVKDLTPLPHDANGANPNYVGSSQGPALLASNCDLTTIPNGVYNLTLSASGGFLHNEATVQFRLESNLKLGPFSFSQQDVVIPVHGIPISVTRTYNSVNPDRGDFGVSWTFAVSSMDITLDETRGEVEGWVDDNSNVGDPGRPATFSQRTGGRRDVTITLPNGRRTTFYYTPNFDTLGDETPAFTPAPGTPPGIGLTVQGSPRYQPDAYGWVGSGMDDDYNTVNEVGDFSGFILSMPDMSTYIINRDDLGTYDVDDYVIHAWGPPHLSEIDEHSGDKILIDQNGITYVSPNNVTKQISFQRNDRGLISSVSDPNTVGSGGPPSVLYEYDYLDNLIHVDRLVDGQGIGTYVTNSFSYANPNLPHYITAILNGDGNPVAQNFYDDSGKLIKVVDSGGNVTRYIHDLTNHMDIIINPLGHTNIAVYDTRGNVAAETNAVGQVVTMAYDGNNNQTNQVIFHNGQPFATNNVTYDSQNQVTNTISPQGLTNSFSYDSVGNLLTQTDPEGHTTTRYYDSNGYLTGMTNAAGNGGINVYNNGLLMAESDNMGNTKTNYYDSNNNLIAVASFDVSSGAILTSNSYAYDDNGNQTNFVTWRRINGVWTGATNATVFDAMDRVIRVIQPDGGVISSSYNELGALQATTNTLGRVTQYFYDTSGRLYRTLNPDGTSEYSYYDAVGNLTNSIDPAGRSTIYVYDAMNRQVQTILSDNTTLTHVYDDLGRVAQMIDARGTITAYGYDVAGHNTAITNGLGTSQQTFATYTYDANGNQITFTDANNRTTTNVFDILNRPIEVDFPDGTKTTTGYNANGQRVAETNQENVVTLVGYDGAGRAVSITNAFGTSAQSVTRYQYDDAGKETFQIDALNRTNSYIYDVMGQVIAHTLPGGQRESFSYDLGGNAIYQTSYNGLIITNRYDVLNRLTNRSSSGYMVAMTYTPTSKRASITDQTGSTVYTYDNRDRLATRQMSWNGGPIVSLNYSYDIAGNLTNIQSTTPNGVNLGYSYDAVNRLTNVVANGIQAASYSFDTVGNLLGIRQGNGVTNLYKYDALNRLTNATWNLNSSPLATFSYALSATGLRTNLSETVAGLSQTYTWGYDSRYRLTNEFISTLGSVSYGYDPVGNRTNRQSGISQLPTANYTYNTNDWLTTDQYDSNGNTTNSAGIPYKYDVDNRLIDYNNGAVFLGYNGDGLRVTKKIGSQTTYFVIDEQNPSGYAQVLEEITVNGTATNLAKVYTYGLELINQRQPGIATNYFGTDGHGSVRFLTDQGGNVTDTYIYDAGGVLLANTGTTPNNYLYRGEQYDSDLKFYYLRSRYLNPNTGRFWTMDSFAGDNSDPMSLHRYLYASDNPVNRIDPSGHDDMVELMCTTAIQGCLGALLLPVLSPIAGGILASLVPDSVWNDMIHEGPDAFLIGASITPQVQLGKLPIQISASGGIEGLWSIKNHNWSGPANGLCPDAVYAFRPDWGPLFGLPGVGLGTGTGVGLSGYAGLAWNTPDSLAYTKKFLTYSFPFSAVKKAVQTVLQTRFLVMQSYLLRITVSSAGDLSIYQSQLSLIAVMAPKVAGFTGFLDKLAFNVFFDPTSSFGKGSYGANVSFNWNPQALNPVSGTSYVGYSATYYYQLWPKEANGDPKKVPFRDDQ